jgi:ATP-dependent helicase/nuclease subunit A
MSNIFDVEHYDISGIEKWNRNKTTHEVLIGKVDNDMLNYLNSTLEFNYPYEQMTIMPQKTTVTKIAAANNLENTPRDYSKEKAKSYAERGTVYHKVLENMTLQENTITDIENVVNNLTAHKVITLEQKDLIDVNKLFNCINDEWFRGLIQNSTYIKKELEFFMLVGNGARQDMVEVQGIIDLLVESNGELYLFDYKTGYLSHESATLKYSAQILEYKKAAEKIFGKKIKKCSIIAVDMGKIFNI